MSKDILEKKQIENFAQRSSINQSCVNKQAFVQINKLNIEETDKVTVSSNSSTDMEDKITKLETEKNELLKIINYWKNKYMMLEKRYEESDSLNKKLQKMLILSKGKHI